MLMLPLPLFIAELLIFIMAVKSWGFLDSLGIYLMPSLLGFVILSLVKRTGFAQMQMSMMSGQKPEKSLLHSGAIFLGAILLIVPSFFTRVLAIILILPGLRHLMIWRFEKGLQNRMQNGVQGGFSFGGPFGFGGGAGAGPAGGGFTYYQYRSKPTGDGFDQESPRERVIDAEVLDVTPLEITHSGKPEDSFKKDSKE